MSDERKRYRFNVPASDEVVQEWSDSQENLSFSLRYVIKTYVKDYGLDDVFASSLEGFEAKADEVAMSKAPEEVHEEKEVGPEVVETESEVEAVIPTPTKGIHDISKLMNM